MRLVRRRPCKIPTFKRAMVAEGCGAVNGLLPSGVSCAINCKPTYEAQRSATLECFDGELTFPHGSQICFFEKVNIEPSRKLVDWAQFTSCASGTYCPSIPSKVSSGSAEESACLQTRFSGS